MKAIVNTSKVFLAATFLSVAFAGCERGAQDQATGAAGTPGTATAPADTAGTPGTATAPADTAGTPGTATAPAGTGTPGTATAPADTAGTTGAGTGAAGTPGAPPDATGARGTTGDTSGTSGAATEDADTSGAGSAAGTVIDDSIITTRVKTALLADDKVKGTDINVETEKGEVMLSGFVESRQQMDEAVKIAQSVEGVERVTNKMTVKQ